MSGAAAAPPGLAWADRPSEEAALFNPAFCGELVARTVAAYAGVRAVALPLPLAHLVLPLTLPPRFRSALPGRMDTAFASWAGEHAELLSTFPARALRLGPVTREALLFMAQVGALAVTPAGVATGGLPLPLSRLLPGTTDEAAAIRRAAALVGRWFAVQGSAAAVLQTMGVRA